MATPFRLQGTLSLPAAVGLAPSPIVASFAAAFESKVELEYVFGESPGTQEVDFGTLSNSGTKCVFLVYEADSGTVNVDVTINGADTPVPLSPGGFFLLGAPSPSDGVTSISLAHGGIGRVRVYLLD